jgi:hypothetical protein
MDLCIKFCPQLCCVFRFDFYFYHIFFAAKVVILSQISNFIPQLFTEFSTSVYGHEGYRTSIRLRGIARASGVKAKETGFPVSSLSL